jgi:hypothetical protein
VPLRVLGNEPKLFVRPSGSLVAILTELQRSEEAAAVFLENAVVMAVQWRQIWKIWFVNHIFFLAALEVLRKGG